MFTCREQKKIVNRPLAGTSKRGNTVEEDEQLSAKLLKDEKQCAEHVMLVDLGRNDVGKVCYVFTLLDAPIVLFAKSITLYSDAIVSAIILFILIKYCHSCF
jgi:isochorismate synthase EntC